MKTAVVTGGSRGIGRAISLELAASGARVVLTCQRDLTRAEATAEEIRRAGGQATALVMDVLKPDDVKAMAERVGAEFGGADILVNTAGVIKDALFPFMKEEDWDYVLDVDLKGAFRVTKALIRGMLHKSSGRIVNVVSVSGISGHAGQANYSAAKGGLIAFTKALARETARYAVNVNCVCPGPTETPLLAAVPDKVQDALKKAIPMRRFGQPSEVADAVLFFASDRARYVTGQVLSVSGGLTMAG